MTGGEAPRVFRVICSWRDDAGRWWNHTAGPFTEKREAFAAYHAETCRRHEPLGEPGCHDLDVELVEDVAGRVAPRTVERWPGPVAGAAPVDRAAVRAAVHTASAALAARRAEVEGDPCQVCGTPAERYSPDGVAFCEAHLPPTLGDPPGRLPAHEEAHS